MYYSLDTCVMGDGWWSSSEQRLTIPEGSSVNILMDPEYCAGYCIPCEEALEMATTQIHTILLQKLI